jgi:hypothetical protein
MRASDGRHKRFAVLPRERDPGDPVTTGERLSEKLDLPLPETRTDDRSRERANIATLLGELVTSDVGECHHD